MIHFNTSQWSALSFILCFILSLLTPSCYCHDLQCWDPLCYMFFPWPATTCPVVPVLICYLRFWSAFLRYFLRYCWIDLMWSVMVRSVVSEFIFSVPLMSYPALTDILSYVAFWPNLICYDPSCSYLSCCFYSDLFCYVLICYDLSYCSQIFYVLSSPVLSFSDMLRYVRRDLFDFDRSRATLFWPTIICHIVSYFGLLCFELLRYVMYYHDMLSSVLSCPFLLCPILICCFQTYDTSYLILLGYFTSSSYLLLSDLLCFVRNCLIQLWYLMCRLCLVLFCSVLSETV